MQLRSNRVVGQVIVDRIDRFMGWNDIDHIKYILRTCGNNYLELPTQFDMTLLCLAVTSCQIDIIETLLQHGANIHALTMNGETPLMIAKRYREPEMIDLLISYGAKF